MKERAPVPASLSVGSFLVIEGPIGVGKTSLARRLSLHLGLEGVFEEPEQNPFLARFYENRQAFALATQLFFLFQRRRLLDDLAQGDFLRAGIVADFLWAKDRVFAGITLDNDEWRLYEQITSSLPEPVQTPDLVVFLQAPVDVLMERIRKRGRAYEHIDRAYLASLAEGYTDFFHRYQDSPLLMVNAAEANFVESDEDLAALVESIRGIHSGRHFFNPLASGTGT
ncbi:MAG: deoxynucleoside kinase [Acidiferrobacter sp.]